MPDQSAVDLGGHALRGQSGQPAALAGRAAELMRDVAADEIPSLVDELNRRYDADGAPITSSAKATATG